MQPFTLVCMDNGIGKLVSLAKSGGVLFYQLAVMVAGNLVPALFHQKLGCLPWPEWPRDQVSQRYHLVNPAFLEICHHLFKGKNVSMDIGKNCNFLHKTSMAAVKLNVMTGCTSIY